MRSFRDGKGREWRLEINHAACKEVRDVLKLDLTALLDKDLATLADFVSDVFRVVDVLLVLCNRTQQKQPLVEKDFLEALAGDAIADAATAITDELVDFFPSRQAREVIRLARKKQQEASEILQRRASAAIAAVNPEELANRLLSGLSSSSGSVPESSESTPAPSPSVSS